MQRVNHRIPMPPEVLVRFLSFFVDVPHPCLLISSLEPLQSLLASSNQPPIAFFRRGFGTISDDSLLASSFWVVSCSCFGFLCLSNTLQVQTKKSIKHLIFGVF